MVMPYGRFDESSRSRQRSYYPGFGYPF